MEISIVRRDLFFSLKMRLSYTGIIGGKALIKFSILLNSDNSQKSIQIWSGDPTPFGFALGA